MALEPETVLKIVVLGGHRVGKTSLLRRYLLDCFTAHYLPTIGADVHSFALDQRYVDHLGCAARVQFWDISHAELRGRSVGAYLSNVHGVVMVFDVTDLKSVHAVDAWRMMVEGRLTPAFSNASARPTLGRRQQRHHSLVPMLLLANKADLGRNIVSSAELDLHAKKSGYGAWRYSSARTGENVVASLDALIEGVVEQAAYVRLVERCNRQLDDSPALDSPALPASPGLFARSSIGEMARTSTMSGASNIMSEASTMPQPPTVRELENKASELYVSLEARLAELTRRLPADRGTAMHALESRRAQEYATLCARVAELSANALDGDEAAFGGAEAAVVRSVAQLQSDLAENAARWKQALMQIELSIDADAHTLAASPTIAAPPGHAAETAIPAEALRSAPDTASALSPRAVQAPLSSGFGARNATFKQAAAADRP